MSVDEVKQSLTIHKGISCCSCLQNFVIKDFSPRSFKCPYILSCGHSACMGCLKNHLRSQTPFTCGTCQQLTVIEGDTDGMINLQSHFFLVGSLVVDNYTKRLESEKIVKRRRPLSSISSSQQCVECAQFAQIFCRHCNSKFCESCSMHVHSMAKALMFHEKVPLLLADVLTTCEIHSGQALDLYCVTCEKIVCCYCIVHYHQNHSVVPAKEKCEAMKDAVLTSTEEIDKALIYIKHSLKEVSKEKKLCSVTSLNLSAIEKSVNTVFARLIGKLQLIQEKFLSDIYTAKCSPKSMWDAMDVNLKNLLEMGKTLKKVINNIKTSDEPTSPSNLPNLKAKIKEFLEAPMFVVKGELIENKPKFDFDDTIFNHIETAFSLDLSNNLNYSFVSFKNLPKDYDLPPVDMSSPSKNDNDDETKSDEIRIAQQDADICSISTDGSVLSEKSDHSKKSLFKGTNDSSTFLVQEFQSSSIGDNFPPGTTFMATITYLKSPNEFYVRQYSDHSKLNFLMSCIEQAAQKATSPSEINISSIYLGQYEEDKKWYRVRVLDESEFNVTVYYIDYGNVSQIDKSMIRHCSEKIKSLLPLAMKCQLYDCYPLKDNWEPTAVQIFEEVFREMSSPSCDVIVYDKGPGVLKVDLHILRSDSIGVEVVSIRDMLVFLGHAVLTVGENKSENSSSNLKGIPKSHIRHIQYPPQDHSAPDELIKGRVVYVHSHKIVFFRKDSDYDIFKTMIREMQYLYTSHPNDGVIYHPYPDMPCAVYFKRTWYRARILTLQLNKTVRVALVDTGDNIDVKHDALRRITDNFVAYPPMAHRCSLAWISTKFPQYDKDIKRDILNLLPSDMSVLIKIIEVTSNGWKILLFNGDVDEEHCINRLLADNNEFVDYDEKLMDLKNILTSSDNKILIDKKMKPKNWKNRNIKGKSKVNEGYSDSDDGEENARLTDDSCGIFRHKVTIIKIESPSTIYLCPKSLMPGFKKMRDNLQIASRECEEDDTMSVTEGMSVAGYSSTYKEWVRGVVEEILPDNCFKLYLGDYGDYEILPMRSIRKMGEDFRKMQSFSLKCRLGGVESAGTTWSSLACDLLRDELTDEHEIFMNRIDCEHDEPLTENKPYVVPVELWVRKFELKGAFAPKEIIDFSVNYMLVTQGLAYRNNEKLVGDINPNSTKAWKKKLNIKNEPVTEAKAMTKEPRKGKIASLESDWLPPKPLSKHKIHARVSYVDDHGILYFCDDADFEELQKLDASLSELYEGSEPGAADLFWQCGQLCIVQYHNGNAWHRGKVLKCNEQERTYEVYFVDYGNVETCDVREMRKHICFQDTPIFCHKCAIADMAPITPEGYTTEVIEYIHVSVVEKSIQIEILDLNKNPMPARVFRIDLNSFVLDILTSHGLVQNLKNPKTVAIKQEKTDTKKRPTQAIEQECKKQHFDKKSTDKASDLNVQPDDGEYQIKYWNPETQISVTLPVDTELPVTISSIYNDELMVMPCKQLSCLPEIYQSIAKLDELEADIVKSASELPLIDKCVPNMCCVAEYAGDNVYYRAFIENVCDHDKVTVCYIDYGNRETISREKIRKCKTSWLEAPSFGISVTLHNAKPFSIQSPNCREAFATLSRNSTQMTMRVIGFKETGSVVELIDPKSGSLIYQSLIDSGIMKMNSS